MSLIGGGEDVLSLCKDEFRLAVMDHGWGQNPQAGMAVLVVVPGDEVTGCRERDFYRPRHDQSQLACRLLEERAATGRFSSLGGTAPMEDRVCLRRSLDSCGFALLKGGWTHFSLHCSLKP